MMLAYACLSRVRRELLLLALIAGGGCERAPDCTLYDTCAGSLLRRADEFAGTKKESCRQCLNTHCATEEQRCSTDIACNFTSRCMLTKSPSAYQKCLRTLYEGRLTFGNEKRYPWEGRGVELDAGGDLTFGECLHERCREHCIEDPFACAKTFSGGETYSQYDVQVEVAVRSYPDYTPQPNVSIRACEDVRRTSAKRPFDAVCEDWKSTDGRGVARVPVREFIPAEALYFEIREEKGNFPTTLYYPGRLGQKELQLIAIYVVKASSIELGNQALRREGTVLKDSAQSLILTDSCVWEKISVPGLRVEVEDASVPQCHELEGGPCDEDAGCTPCVWYAKKESPDFNAERTDGTGAGIVGLDAGFYTIKVLRGEDEQVGGRTVRMENGAMTIVRTWPPFEQVPSTPDEP